MWQSHSLLAFNPGDPSRYDEIAEKIATEGLAGERTFQFLESILEAGPRFAGTEGYASATRISLRLMEDLGFDRVWLESVEVPRWLRGEPEEARIVKSNRFAGIPLNILALGGSVATPPEGITAGIVEVKSFAELQSISSRVKEKIVFFNRPMERRYVDSFRAYGEAVNQRSRGAIEAAKYGAAAVLVRSITTQIDSFPHTGGMRYDSSLPLLPAAALSTSDADMISELLHEEPDISVYLKINSSTLPDVENHNVIGELRGAAVPDEVIVVACHLDSWDISVGAHDNAAGCAQAIQALALLKDAGLRPKRTIRAVLYANEEFGVSGGRGYAISPLREGERHIAAIESDRGGFLPIGFTIDSTDEVVGYFKRYVSLFQRLQMYQITKGFGGVDISPLKQSGTIAIGLLPDSQRYFDIHHSAKDTIDKVNPRELELGSIAMAILAYVISEDGIPEEITAVSPSN